MGKIDSYSKEYISRNDIFADAVNYALYRGKQRVHKEDLSEQDVTEISIPYTENDDKTITLTVQKIRDVLKLYTVKQTPKTTYLIVGIENQANIHYAMSVKNMLYDALNYASQVNELARRNRKDKNFSSDEEFLSGLTEADRLKPVVTIVIYWGTKEWNAPRCLHDMLDADEEFLQFVENYRLNLIIPSEIEDFDKFSTELGSALKFIKNAEDKTKIGDILNTDSHFKAMDQCAAGLLEAVAGIRISDTARKGWVVDMCKAWEDQKQEGIEQGSKAKAEEVARKAFLKGLDYETVKDLSELPDEVLQKIKEERN